MKIEFQLPMHSNFSQARSSKTYDYLQEAYVNCEEDVYADWRKPEEIIWDLPDDKWEEFNELIKAIWLDALNNDPLVQRLDDDGDDSANPPAAT